MAFHEIPPSGTARELKAIILCTVYDHVQGVSNF